MNPTGYIASLMAGILLLFLLASPALIHSKPDDGFAVSVAPSQELVNDFATAETAIDQNILQGLMANTNGAGQSVDFGAFNASISSTRPEFIGDDRMGISNMSSCSAQGITAANPSALTYSVELTLECHSRSTPQMAISRTLTYYKKVIFAPSPPAYPFDIQASGDNITYTPQFHHT
jgi:hypothetical protein